MKKSELKALIIECIEELEEVEVSEDDLEEESESEIQQQAAGAALAAKRGEIPKSELRGASLRMYNDMDEKQLADFATTKHDTVPHKVKEDFVPVLDDNQIDEGSNTQDIGEFMGVKMTLLGSVSYQALSLGIRGERDELALKRSIKRELKKRDKKKTKNEVQGSSSKSLDYGKHSAKPISVHDPFDEEPFDAEDKLHNEAIIKGNTLAKQVDYAIIDINKKHPEIWRGYQKKYGGKAKVTFRRDIFNLINDKKKGVGKNIADYMFNNGQYKKIWQEGESPIDEAYSFKAGQAIKYDKKDWKIKNTTRDWVEIEDKRGFTKTVDFEDIKSFKGNVLVTENIEVGNILDRMHVMAGITESSANDYDEPFVKIGDKVKIQDPSHGKEFGKIKIIKGHKIRMTVSGLSGELHTTRDKLHWDRAKKYWIEKR